MIVLQTAEQTADQTAGQTGAHPIRTRAVMRPGIPDAL